VLATAAALLREGTLVPHAIVSMWRSCAGLLLAASIAVPLGLALAGWKPRLGEDLGPLLRLLGQVNPFSLMPLFMLFFGLGETAKLAVLAWVSVWPILHNTVTGVRTIDPAILRSARSMGVSGPAYLFRVLLPAAAPSIFVGLRTGGGLVFFMLIGAEMIGAGAGLGWFMHNAGATYQVPRIYASAVIIVALGVLLNAGLRALERRVPLRIGPRGLAVVGVAMTAAVLAAMPVVQEIDVHGAQVMHHHGAANCGDLDASKASPDDLERISKEFAGER
jgi:NitT/TauT family transport system permease protein